MPLRPSILAVTLLPAVTVWACSNASSGSACSHEACGGPSPLSYEACGTSSDLTTYNFGGQSCSCPASDAAECFECKSSVIAWCEGLQGLDSSCPPFDSGSGSGGSSSGGGSGSGSSSGVFVPDGGPPPCNLSVSGAVSGAFPCSVSVTYSTAGNRGDVTISVADPRPLQLITLSLQQPGVPMTGNWANTDTGASGGITVEGESDATVVPTWACTVGGTAPQGTYTMQLHVGAAMPEMGGEVFGASGTLDAVLPGVTSTGATGTVSLHADF
jgi:hypothetical protein